MNRILSTICCLTLLGSFSYGIDHHAYHAHENDQLGWSDSEYNIPLNRTTYTPDLDFETRFGKLVGKVVDEVSLTLVFDQGVVPDISKLKSVRYGSELSLELPNAAVKWRVEGQLLHVWYGFHDHRDGYDENSPKLTTDSNWTFSVEGDDPISQVMFFVSWHGPTQNEMPDLYGGERLKKVTLADLEADSSESVMTGGKLAQSEGNKLIVLVHGWNPYAKTNHYAHDDTWAPWSALSSALLANPAFSGGGWSLARYDWARDANTGTTKIMTSPGVNLPNPAILYNANASRDAAAAHGLKLGRELASLNPSQVHFVAHSAGNWMARRAAAYLKSKFGSQIKIQQTCLDPFVNSDLGLDSIFELASNWLDAAENYYALDRNPFGSGTDFIARYTSDTFLSGQSDLSTWKNRYIGDSSFFEPEMEDHAGPIVWYGATSEWSEMTQGLLGINNEGYINSLCVREDHGDQFPGALIGSSAMGERLILNIHSTSQPGEPTLALTATSKTVWTTWEAPQSGNLTFEVWNSRMFDSFGFSDPASLPAISVFNGSSLSGLTQVGTNFNGTNLLPSISINAVAGQQYRIAVDGVNGARGLIRLSWSMDGVSPPNTPFITAPTANQTVTGTVAVDASANAANAVEFYLDGIKQHRDEAAPFSWPWNTLTSANGSHQLSVKSFNGEAIVGTSASVVVNVNNTITPAVDVDEPNNRSTQATGPLTSGVVRSAKIASSSDVDWYKFDVPGPGTFSLKLVVPTNTDYDLELYGPAFEWITGAYNQSGQAGGELDLEFGTGGIAETPQFSAPNSYARCESIVVCDNGYILGAGWSANSNGRDFALVRFSPDGLLDDQFGANGIVTTEFGSKDDEGMDLAVQSDGKIVVVGNTEENSIYGDFALARYNPDGTPDLGFGVAGKVITSLSSQSAISESAESVLIQNDGKIIAAGYCAGYKFATARFHPNGSLDASFGTDGKVTTSFGSTNDKAYDAVLQPDGKIVLVGGTAFNAIALCRYTNSGALDGSFGVAGKVTTDAIPNKSEEAASVALQTDGKLLVAGYHLTSNNTGNFLLIRYQPNGELDQSFGSGGIVTTDFGGSDDRATSVKVLIDGSVLLCGYAGSNFALARYSSFGVLDTTFGTGGMLILDLGASDQAKKMAIQDDLKIVVAGYTQGGPIFNQFSNFAIIRYASGLGTEMISRYMRDPGTHYARVYGYPAGNGSFSATNSYTLTYTFTPGIVTPTHSLELISSSGTVQRSNPGPDYSEGQTVTLTPVPNPGYQFAGWTGDASGTANPLTVTMSADKKIVASFAPVASASFQGNVTVNLEPPEAVAAGAQWRLLSDGVWRNSGATAAVSTQSLQTVEFKTTTGYFSPGKQTISVNRAASDLRLTGDYRLKAFDAGSGFLDVGDLPPTLSSIEGQSASLTVQAAGTGTLTYQWFLGAYPVEGATSATLVLTNVETSLVGEKFSCVVSNGTLSKQTNGCEFIVLSPPVISQHPAATSAPAGGAVSFRVAATGTSPFRYQWKLAGADIAGATSEVLHLTNLQAGDAASYTVVVSNDAGSATSNAAVLTVTGSAPTASGNDSFAGASLIPDAAITQTGNNTSATRETNEPLVSGSEGGHSLWWKWTAPSTGRFTITTEGSGFDTTLGVYIGNVLNALALVAEDDDSGGRSITSTISFDTLAGQTYNIAVDGHDATDTGDIRLRIDLSTPATAAPAPVAAIHEVLAVMGQTPLGLKPQALAQHSDGSLFVCYGDGGPYSFGSIVKHNLDGSSSLMHGFTGTNGSFPNRIIRASDGNFYGTTLAGAANNLGGLFKLTPAGEFTLLTSFTTTNGYDSKWIMEGSNGFLYLVQRTTSSGSVVGSILKCSKSAGGAQVKFYQVPSGLTNGHSPVHLCELADGTFALTCTTGGANSRGVVRFLSSAGVSLLKVDLTTDITTSGNALGLVQASNGLLYGTSRSGGANSAGTIFSLSTTGVLTALYAFPSGSGTTNSSAVAPPVLGPDGKIYGVTYGGGASNLGSAYAYEIGVGYSLLTSFTSTTAAGRLPVCLAMGSDGNLYGASSFGGQNFTGAIFGLSTAGTFGFTKAVESSPGTIPTRVSQTADGTLYWMTNDGGPSNFGQVWRKPAAANASVLAALNGTVSNPARSAVLLPALDGNFYFMSSNASGVGALVRVSPAGASTRLATFTSGTAGTGTSPQGYLVQSADGTFYGTAFAGGTNGEGTVFKYTTAGGLVALASMATATTGRAPTDVVLGGDGNIYAISTAGAGATGAVFSVTPSGTVAPVYIPTSASAFGSTPRSLSLGDDGLIYASTSGTGTSGGPTVFEVTPAGSTRLVGVFSNATTGSPVEGPLTQDENDDLFGTAPTGGSNDEGTLFKLSQSGVITVLHHFDMETGNTPQYGVIRGADGDLYGSTYHQYGVATIYRVTYLPPDILSVSPAQAPPGATVTITGKHFAKASRVQFGNLDAPSFSLVSNTEITAVVPAGFRTGALSVTNPLGTGVSPPYSTPTLSNLQLWREAYFGTSESADIADDLNDLEGDGVQNLAEFAFGMNPYSGGQHDRMPKGAEATHNSQRYLAINFRRRIGEASIAYEVEESDDLSNWTTLNISAQQVGHPVNNGDGTETVIVRASVPMEGPGSQPKCFLRVVVERSP